MNAWLLLDGQRVGMAWSVAYGAEGALTYASGLLARPERTAEFPEALEAALDDVNLHRFLSLVAEFRSTAQLLIVSHQKRTMEAADCLVGVSMQPGGSSRVVTERASVTA